MCDADELAHNLMKKGQPVCKAVAGAFGAGFVGPDGGIDRAKLGRHVFDRPGELEKLNRLVHPEVRRLWDAWLAEKAGGDGIRAVVVPLLYEADAGDGWDGVICVACSTAIQTRRLMDRGFSNAEALARIAAQMPVGRKMQMADYVIYNDASKEFAGEQAKRILRRMQEKRICLREI